MENQEQKVKEFIKQNDYTWTYDDIMQEYSKWKNGIYISFTAKKVINACIDNNCQVYT